MSTNQINLNICVLTYDVRRAKVKFRYLQNFVQPTAVTIILKCVRSNKNILRNSCFN